MNFTDREKELLLSNAAVFSRIKLYGEDGTVLQVFNEDDYLVEWNYEDYRYVPDKGFIGQFVERLLDGTFMNVPEGISLQDREIELEVAVKDPNLQEQVYHSYGRFIITKVEEADVSGNYKFEASDYTKKFNIAFDIDATSYPCLAIELLNDAINKAEVSLTGDDGCFAYAVTSEGLTAGNYCFSTYVEDTLTYFNFTTSQDLSFRDSLMLVFSKGKVIQRVVNSDYSITETELPYVSSETQVGTLLSQEPLRYAEFVNNNFVIENNQFDEGQSCRDVVSAIAKLGYTWARVGTDNKLHLDFVKKTDSDVDELNEIDIDKYYEAKVTGDTIKPINKVLIGMSQVDGENIYAEQSADRITLDKLYGDTSQDGSNRYQLLMNTNTNNGYNYWSSYSTFDKQTRTLTRSTTSTTENFIGHILNGVIENNTTYTLSAFVKQNGKVSSVEFFMYGTTGGAVGVRSKSYNDIGTSWVRKSWTFTTDASANYSTANVRFDNNGSITSGQEAILYVKDVMLEKGSTAHDYEDYPASPDYPQPVNTVTGENVVEVYQKNRIGLVDGDYSVNDISVVVSNGILTVNGTASAATNVYIPLIEPVTLYKGDTYTFSSIKLSGEVQSAGQIAVRLLTGIDSGESFGGTYKTLGTKNTYTQTKEQTFKSVLFYINPNYSTTNAEIGYQLERGSSITDYAEYHKPQKYEIDLGKNLWDKSSILWFRNNNTSVFDDRSNNNTVRIKSIPISIQGGKTYTISGLPSGITLNSAGVICYNANKSFLGSNYAPYTNGTFTLPSDVVYIAIMCNGENFTDATNTLMQNADIQLEEGAVATSYAPYYRVSKNLFDKNNMIRNYVSSFTVGNVPTMSSNNTRCTYSLDKAIEVLPNTTYTLYGNNSNYKFAYCDMDTNKISLTDSGWLSNNMTFTTKSNAKYLSFDFRKADNTAFTDSDWNNLINSNIQLEEGSTATYYEPYDKHIELCKIGNYKDYISKSTGKNLLNKDNMDIENFYVGTEGKIHTSATDYTYIIPFEKEGTFTFSLGFTTNRIRASEHDSIVTADGTQLSMLAESSSTASTLTFTTTSNCKYLYISIGNSTYVKDLNVAINTSQIENGSIATNYEPYGNGEWYEYHKIVKYIISGDENIAYVGDNSDANYSQFNIKTVTNWVDTDLSNGGSLMYCNEFSYYNQPHQPNKTQAGIRVWSNSNPLIVVSFPTPLLTSGSELASFKTWLGSHNMLLYAVRTSPITQKITYQPLIDQLNAIERNAKLYEGKTYITSRGVEINPKVDISITDLNQSTTSYTNNTDYEINGHEYEESTLKIYDNPLTHSEELRRIAINGCETLYGLTYTPMTINSIGHPWLEGDDFVKLTNLAENDLYTYPFDRKIEYKGYIANELSSVAENQVKEKYENPNNILYRVTHTEIDVDKANQRIDLLSQSVDGNTTNISNIQMDINGINTNVSHIENVEITGLQSQISTVNQTISSIASLFQITGGINAIRNSAFLLNDNVWEFTDNGTSPYHTELGDSYNVALSGTTVSIAEIKFRSTKIKSKSENVTNLKTDGTKYTFNFYHKQDNYMTTTIKMYSTENNNVKAFDDIIITGQQPFKNYEVSFIPTYTNYTIEIISTSTSSIGYSYLYDMMLNSGDKQPWQPASDEIYSTTLKMSRLGLQVYSVGDGTITLLGSDGMATYETRDGKTLGRLVSSRTVDGDRTRAVTTQSVYLSRDITQDSQSKWVETIVNISGNPYKVEYVEDGA